MVEFFIFYFVIGLIVNWGVALWGMFSEYEEIDPMGFILTIPIWPLTVYNIITIFTNGE